MITALFDITNWFMRMYKGDDIAWIAFVAVILTVMLLAAGGVVWWKLPSFAKKVFFNNIRANNPTIANAYDDRVIRFETPQVFGSGIMYNGKGGWFFPPHLMSELADGKLGKDERSAITGAYHIQGSSSAFYLACSIKGAIINPEVASILEHPEFYEKLKDERFGSVRSFLVGDKPAEGIVRVSKVLFMDAVKRIEGDYVTISPVHITTRVDPAKIKEYLPQMFTKSMLLAIELKVKEIAARVGGRMDLIKLVLILSGVSVLISGVIAAKLFGVF